MPMIAISGEADDENFSLSDSEEANKAKTLIASRMRRRQKKKRDDAKPSAALVVDDGDESGLTDVETVDCDGDDDSNTESSNTPAEELAPVFEIRPHIVHIVEDEDGKMLVNTIVRGVIATEDGDDSDGNEAAGELADAATDIEHFEDTSSDEGESSVSESSEMRRAIGSTELGGNVEARSKEEEGKQVPRATSGSSLQLPVAGRKKSRKHRAKKKATATATSGGLLAVASRDDEQLTDVESISGMEELEMDPPSPTAAKAGAFLTVTPAADDGATDVESISGVDDDSASVSIHLAPGILVTGDGDDVSTASGRSSRLGLTDVEDLPGDESPIPFLGLSLPQASADPLTDVEDIDGVEEDERTPLRIPRNGPALHSGQSHVVDITEDEHGRVTSRKMARSPALLSVGFGQDDGGVTETESVGVSGDEGDDVSAEHPAPDIQLDDTTVEHKSDPAEVQDPEAVESDAPPSRGFSLMPPATAAEILTDTEDMEMSDSEAPATTGQTFGYPIFTGRPIVAL